jgi:hypothetical protein
MSMYACPWCGQKSFSFWEKQMLGPHKSIHCESCKRKVSVDWARAQVAAAPTLLLFFLGMIAGKVLFMTWPAILLGGWLGITLGMLITGPLYHLYVPLVKPTN